MKHFLASFLTASAALTAFAPAQAAEVSTTTPVMIDFGTWDQPSFEDQFQIFDLDNDKVSYELYENTSWMKYSSNVCRIKSSYPREENQDDWLITKNGISMKAGKTYKIMMRASSYTVGQPATFSVSIGTACDPSAMTKEVIEISGVATVFDSPVELTGTFTVPADGNYHLGVHSTTTPTGFWSVIHSIGISANDEVGAPATPSAPEVEADANGGISTRIRVRAPKFDLMGQNLGANDLTQLLVYRDGKPVTDASNKQLGWYDADCVPGEHTVWINDTDATGLTEGTHRYTVVAVNNEGRSEQSAATIVYVGVNRPAAPTNVRAYATVKAGEVTISWDAPLTDVDGNPMSGALVMYKVCEITNGTETELASGITDNSYTYQALTSGAGQEYKRYRVYAGSAAGYEMSADSDKAPVGTASRTPYSESFAGNTSALFDFSRTTGSGSWAFRTSGVDSQDGDNAAALFTAAEHNDAADMLSANVYVPTGGAMLTFYYSGLEKGNTNYLELLIDGGDGVKSVANYSLKSGVWQLGSMSLADYAGKNVRYGFRAYYNDDQFYNVAVDNVKIRTTPKRDVALASLEVGDDIVNHNATVSVRVMNLGSETASKVVVNLLRDGKIIATEQGDINAGTVARVPFSVKLVPDASGKMVLTAQVVLAGDEDNSNDTCAPVEFTLSGSSLPVVSDLKGAQNNGGVQLSWSSPSIEDAHADPVTESFENATPWAETLDGWTFLDKDNADRASSSYVGGYTFPGISGKKGGWFVLDATGMPEFEGYTGTKVLCSEGSADQSAVDEWIILPQLDGSEQKITFYLKATAANSSFPALSMYESSFGTSPKDFTSLQSYSSIPAGRWIKVEQIVSEDALYFAIRCTASDRTEFLIDEITYRPSFAGGNLAVSGYNVYCDNKQVNAQLVTDNSFTHTGATEGAHQYAVTTVYNNGAESNLSNVVDVNVNLAAIDEIAADDACVAITASEGAVCVTSAKAIEVVIAALDGRTLYTGVCNGALCVELPAGVYVVRADRKAQKVVVR